MKLFTSRNQQLGEIGEDLAVRFLKERGFSIVERNYTKKCGEIDIVAQKQGKFHFVEVKAVSYETLLDPAENLHTMKMQRFSRTIQVYLLEKRVSYETPWQMDALLVRVDVARKKAKIDRMPNLIA